MLQRCFTTDSLEQDTVFLGMVRLDDTNELSWPVIAGLYEGKGSLGNDGISNDTYIFKIDFARDAHQTLPDLLESRLIDLLNADAKDIVVDKSDNKIITLRVYSSDLILEIAKNISQYTILPAKQEELKEFAEDYEFELEFNNTICTQYLAGLALQQNGITAEKTMPHIDVRGEVGANVKDFEQYLLKHVPGAKAKTHKSTTHFSIRLLGNHENMVNVYFLMALLGHPTENAITLSAITAAANAAFAVKVQANKATKSKRQASSHTRLSVSFITGICRFFYRTEQAGGIVAFRNENFFSYKYRVYREPETHLRLKQDIPNIYSIFDQNRLDAVQFALAIHKYRLNNPNMIRSEQKSEDES